MSQLESKLEDLQPRRASPARPPLTQLIVRGLTLASIIGVAVFLLVEARGLWREWTYLQIEQGNAHQSEVVGYRDIAPMASYAQGPSDWFRDSGAESQLWWKWEGGVGHKWFHFTQGDIDRARLRRPATQFVSRAIDYPVVEINGGEIWHKIPSDATVVGHTLRGLKCAYPTTVLGKVQVVNDLVQDHPFLIVVNLFAPIQDAFSIFDADLEGHRLTMAASGYFHDGKPLLYDRGTESLWSEAGESLKAIAGKHKGIHLARVAHPAPVTWQAWCSQNRQCRLLVGADRSRGVPLE
jgi:hypothetical protein